MSDDLTPEQQSELSGWQNKASKAKKKFTPEDRKTWGFTGETRKEQQEIDEARTGKKKGFLARLFKREKPTSLNNPDDY